MRAARGWPAVLAAAAVASCTPGGSGTPASPTQPERRPITDSAPHLCSFIPQAVVSEVSGYNGAIKAGPGQRSEIGETCVISNGEQSLLITGYERSAEERHLTNFAGSAAREGRVELPAELGKGSMGDHTIRGHPFRAAGAWFRCGDRRPLITIYVKRNPARDQDHDLVQLMRIAQRRFAEMFTCDLGAPPPP